MAVFERIDLALVQELLRAVTGMGSELEAVSFENQVTVRGSVPDAQISARFSWWFETKTEIDAYAREGHSRAQLRNHSTVLDDPGALLFVITPDPVRPAWFEKLDGLAEDAFRDRILWFSFRDLADAIGELITDPARVVGEQTRFLLAELVALYEADGLLSADDTVVVAARAACPECQRLGAYVCQPNRSFRAGLKYLGFYAEGAIQLLIRISASTTPPFCSPTTKQVHFAPAARQTSGASSRPSWTSGAGMRARHTTSCSSPPSTTRGQSALGHPSPTTKSPSQASPGGGRSASATPAWTSSLAA
jgi:hypothetical protein